MKKVTMLSAMLCVAIILCSTNRMPAQIKVSTSGFNIKKKEKPKENEKPEEKDSKPNSSSQPPSNLSDLCFDNAKSKITLQTSDNSFGVTIVAHVRNSEKTGSNQIVNVNFYLSEDKNISATDTLLGKGSFNNGIPGNSSGPLTLKVNLAEEHYALKSGKYFIGVMVDVENNISESQENNNTLVFEDKIDYALPPGMVAAKVAKEKEDVLMPGITDEFHLKNGKKIIFSSTPINEKIEAAKLIQTYTVGNPLYCRILMDNNIAHYVKSTYASVYNKYGFKDPYGGENFALYYKFYLDGKKTYEGSGNLDLTDEQKKSATSISAQLVTDKKEELQNITSHFFKFLFENNNSISGIHQFKMEVYIYHKNKNETFGLLGEGEFTIKLEGINKNNPVFCHQETAVISDPALEAKMIKLFNEEHKGKVTAKKAYLKYTSWSVQKNDLTGAILRKARVAVLYTESVNGGFCHYGSKSFAMEYEGNGKYGEMYFAGPAQGGDWDVLCECKK